MPGEAETVGEPDEGKLHVRFDEGRLGTDRVRGLWRTTRRWVTAGERSSALNPVPHQPPTPQQVLRIYLGHYNTHRPHRSLDQRAPASPLPVKFRRTVDIGAVYRRDRLGGLIHEYEIAA